MAAACRALTLLLALACAPEAAAQCYAVDAAHGSVTFLVDQAGAPFKGAFRRFGGTLCLQGDAVTRIDVWLEPASTDTGLPELDAALKGGEFFAADQYPRVSFKSASIDMQRDREVARGVLEIKGTRREAAIPFRLQGGAAKPVVSGSFDLNRLDYGIGTGEWSNTKWLGGEVTVDFRAALSPE
ncbi:MAG: YceI family protein [Betaproteobacteria bacterium]|nr:YceI family protein [Betaproteobacteria bacterium]